MSALAAFAWLWGVPYLAIALVFAVLALAKMPRSQLRSKWYPHRKRFASFDGLPQVRWQAGTMLRFVGATLGWPVLVVLCLKDSL